VKNKRPALFRGRHFQDEIIVLCLRWYLRHSLSYRDLEEMMAERGLNSGVRRRGSVPKHVMVQMAVDHRKKGSQAGEMWLWLPLFGSVGTNRLRRKQGA
jgi:transposase-like protein